MDELSFSLMILLISAKVERILKWQYFYFYICRTDTAVSFSPLSFV